ncbi:triose-phosphate isomerase family protein [Microbacterium sp. NPDC058389]|uniref:triose-phosphate isomerase family protein n=1 Tax=Microbacterium sp. NPDC058389 TaxID=3346475 RepID=UPI003653322C
MTIAPLVAVSHKAYFDARRTRQWLASVAKQLAARPRGAATELLVLPATPLLGDAVTALAGTGASVGVQDVSAHGLGAHTGELPAELAKELGAAVAMVGHAERRRDQGETDDLVRRKAAAVWAAGITPLICVGETQQANAAVAAAKTVAQLLRVRPDIAPQGARMIVAYEPVWAIGAADAAPDDYVVQVCEAIRSEVAGLPIDSRVIYGGSAGPGQLTRLADHVDGLFLGRRAHDPAALISVLDEALTLNRTARRHKTIPSPTGNLEKLPNAGHRDEQEQW